MTFNVIIGVSYIYNAHGPDGIRDQTMKDLDDIGRIQFVLDNYDIVEYGGKVSSYTTIKPNGYPTLAESVIYKKAINGTICVVEAVPDTRAKTAFIVSAFKENKNKEAQHPVSTQGALTRTSENADVETSTEINISFDDAKVKDKFSMDLPIEKTRERAVEEFGTTTRFSEAGYLLPDGQMLDFSGKNDGGPKGARTIDHREIDAENTGGISYGEGNAGSDRNGQRTYGVAAAKPSESIYGGAGETQAGREARRRAAADIAAAVEAKGVVSVSTASQGIAAGTNNKTLKIVPSMRFFFSLIALQLNVRPFA